MSKVLDNLRAFGLLSQTRDEQTLRQFASQAFEATTQFGWDNSARGLAFAEILFADHWLKAGSVTYELTHGMAALFAMTSAPPLDMRYTPHDAFVLKVPRTFLPVVGTIVGATDTWIFVGKGGALLVPDYDTTAVGVVLFGTTMQDIEQSVKDAPQEMRLCMRFVANAIAYINQHRESTHPKGAEKSETFVLRPPKDVVITRAFRDAASQVVHSTSLASVRRALAHVVRGHWRDQAVGPKHSQRRMTWIKPHRRGDESLGSVIARIEKVTVSPSR